MAIHAELCHTPRNLPEVLARNTELAPRHVTFIYSSRAPVRMGTGPMRSSPSGVWIVAYAGRTAFCESEGCAGCGSADQEGGAGSACGGGAGLGALSEAAECSAKRDNDDVDDDEEEEEEEEEEEDEVDDAVGPDDGDGSKGRPSSWGVASTVAAEASGPSAGEGASWPGRSTAAAARLLLAPGTGTTVTALVLAAVVEEEDDIVRGVGTIRGRLKPLALDWWGALAALESTTARVLTSWRSAASNEGTREGGVKSPALSERSW